MHAPLGLRAKHHENIGLVQAHGIHAYLVGANPCHDAVDLGNFGKNCSLYTQIQVDRLVQRNRGQFFELYDNVSLIHCWHKALANQRIDTTGHNKDRKRSDCHPLCMVETPAQCRYVQRLQFAWQPRLFMRNTCQEKRRKYRDHGQ